MRYRETATTLRAAAMAFAVSMLLTGCDVATVEETLADIMGGPPQATAQLDDATTSDRAGAGGFTSPTAADHAAARAAEDATSSPTAPSVPPPPAPRAPDAPTSPPLTGDDAAADPAPAPPEAADGGAGTPPSDQDEGDAAPTPAVPADADSAAPDADEDEKPAPRPEPSADEGADGEPLASVEQQVHDLLQAERQRAGLPPLQLDRELSEGARDWSRRMATEQFFSHDSSGSFAENIAYGYPTAQAVHDGWMASTGHRDNRMNSRHTTYGIGVYELGDTVYYTERFR